MKATKQIDIFLTKKRNVRLIDVVQYDTGIQLVFTVKDFTIPSGATATLYVQKPSGKFVFQEDGITVSGSVVTINLENQAITEHGKVPYQVSLKNGADVITTFAGVMMVEKSLKDAGATESVTVIRAFDEAVSDHVAEFQTKAEQIVQACIATLPDNYTAMEAKVNDLANAVKGYLSGAVVAADDVSPVEHNPDVWVHGKNLFNGELLGGVYLSESFALDTLDESVFKSIKVHLKPGTYTLSFGKKANIVRSVIDGAYAIVGYVGVTKHTFTVATNGYVGFTFRDSTSITTNWDNSVSVQLETGTVATDYEPYIDPFIVTVRRCGKNIFDISAIENGSGIVNDGNTLTISAHVAQTVVKLGEICKGLKVGVTATLSFNTTAVNKQTSQTTDYIYLVEAKQSWKSGDTKIITQEMLDSSLYFYAGKNTDGSVITATISNVQVEAGTVATAFEPYNSALYVPADDGTVSGVTSLSPNMTILTDTEGVIVECEYNRDTTKVIDKLINAITALGGTV